MTNSLILPAGERYCIPQINSVRFIQNRQTLALVLGSCISTVFLGRQKDDYILSANHIVIASPREKSIIATKNAMEQIEEIFRVYENDFNILRSELLCLHIIGGGRKKADKNFDIHKKNISEVTEKVHSVGFKCCLRDVRSHFNASYSIHDKNLSIMIEDAIKDKHISFSINMEKLFHEFSSLRDLLPAASLQTGNAGFEALAARDVITLIIGSKNRC